MATRIQFRRGLASEWTAANPTLAQGEIGLELDSGQFKIGDGFSPWTSIQYGGIQGPQGADGLSPVDRRNPVPAMYMIDTVTGDTMRLEVTSGSLTVAEQFSIPASGLQVYCTTKDSSTLHFSGGHVTQWDDKSGNNNHLIPALSNGQPVLWDSTLFGGIGGINMPSAVVQYLKTTNAVSAVDVGSFTIMCVMYRMADGMLPFIGESAGPTHVSWFPEDERLGYRYGTTEFGTPMSEPFITAQTNNAGTGKYYLSDGPARLITTTAYSPHSITTTGAMGTVYVGGNAYGNTAETKFGAFLIWNRVLTDAEIAGAAGYLTTQFAIPYPTQTANVVLCGNSFMQGFGMLTTPFAKRMRTALSLTPIDIIQAAQGGQTTPGLISNGASQVDAFYNSDLVAKKNVAVVWEISNDLYLNGASDTTAYNNIKTYCQARKSAGYKVVVCHCLPRTAGGTPVNFETYRNNVNALLSLNAVSEGWADQVVSFPASISATNASNDGTYYAGDGTHLNDTGTALAVTAIATAVSTVMA